MHLFDISSGYVGVHIQVDQWLFNCVNGCSILPPVLQFPVHTLAQSSATQDGGTVPELRGYPHELSGITCYPSATHQSNSAKTVQGTATRWCQVCVPL